MKLNKIRNLIKTAEYRIFMVAFLVSYSFTSNAQAVISYYQVAHLIKQISLCLVPVGAFMVFWEMQHGGDARKTIIRVVGGCASIGFMYVIIRKMFGV